MGELRWLLSVLVLAAFLAGAAPPHHHLAVSRFNWLGSPLPLSAAAPMQFRISARGGAYDFDRSADGRRWHSLVHGADGTVLSIKPAGGFIGVGAGLYAHDGTEGRADQ